ncbi:large-conductance mechanosensitive channel protein MscL [Candidatus Nomurabacteria bacterium]|nr:large-conductance mechanosensitive channel protein MscL [Candidatus Kaiserbacteria bacterium]MCB9810384.1 large-conductance mechanosensitive channel protein MscL [Candidatus Nomurabacteria bacterium]MCB9818034.1 large-conductance mechanosensitive channel protein MscL [Candidatus Nomurabacteria bacterium]
MKGFVAEFKAFAMKGNVIDLAVAVVIGAAFGKIVSSLVANIITPIIGLIMGGIDFSGMAYMVGDAEITYGVFIQSVIDFLIVALVIFMVVKGINKAKDALDKEEEVKEEKPAEPSEEVKLLREIRDSVKK